MNCSEQHLCANHNYWGEYNIRKPRILVFNDTILSLIVQSILH